MAKPTSGALPVARSEPRTRTALLLESIALRHQIAVLERCGTRRPCFRFWDRLFWILFSRWWPQWRDSLIIVQPETVLRWRREGWSALWRYSSRGRWRGGRPRASSEVRQLIAQMARQNFLWGAPRIHGELLMLGFGVFQATVSRYMPAQRRRPGQSWRTFLRNQAMAFVHSEYYEERSRGDAGPQGQSSWPSSSDPGLRRLRRYGLGSGAPLGDHSPP
jgi:putative transposase